MLLGLPDRLRKSSCRSVSLIGAATLGAAFFVADGADLATFGVPTLVLVADVTDGFAVATFCECELGVCFATTFFVAFTAVAASALPVLFAAFFFTAIGFASPEFEGSSSRIGTRPPISLAFHSEINLTREDEDGSPLRESLDFSAETACRYLNA